MGHPKIPDPAQAGFYETLSLNLRYYRNRLEMTQVQVADRVDCSPKYISILETSCFDNPPSLPILFYLAEALEVEPYKLLKPLA